MNISVEEKDKKPTDNVCFCKCHEAGSPQCIKCKAFHIAQDGTATHENDKSNPDIQANVE